MEPMRIFRPVFTEHERKHQGKEAYVRGMLEHIQATEDWLRMMHEVDDEGWGVCQWWALEHRDGRVARLPDPWLEQRERFIKEGLINKFNLK